MTTDAIREQAKAIREHSEKQPVAPKETPREARWRVEREKAQRDAKQNPHRGY